MPISNPLTASMLAPTRFQYCSNNEILKRMTETKKHSMTKDSPNLNRQKAKLLKYIPNTNELLGTNSQLPKQTVVKFELKNLNAQLVNGKKYSYKVNEAILEPVDSDHKFHFKFSSSPEVNKGSNKVEHNIVLLNSKIPTKQEKSNELVESVILFNQDSLNGKAKNSWLNMIQRNRHSSERNTFESSATHVNSFTLDSSETIQYLSNSKLKKSQFLPPIKSSGTYEKYANFTESSCSSISEKIRKNKKSILKGDTFETKLVHSEKQIDSNKNVYSEIIDESYCDMYNPNFKSFLINQTLVAERVN